MKVQRGHKQVISLAKELAGELYDTLMKDDILRKRWIERCGDVSERQRLKLFIDMALPKAIPAARATLAHMLSLPIEESLKSTIHEALVLDAAFLNERNGNVHLVGAAK